ncbi:hypothetical protein PG997_015275 [Apiospora hydei]|uniref:DUF3971 domain-containing protein n=1 Tax=Apiospora hydei TaxID=1337664 RepID=A0ABR1UT89_9PEZI
MEIGVETPIRLQPRYFRDRSGKMLELEAKFEQTWPLILPGGVSGKGLGELQLSAKVWDRPAALGAFQGLELQAAQEPARPVLPVDLNLAARLKDEHGRVQSAGDSSFPIEQLGYVSRGQRWPMVLQIAHQKRLGMQPHAGVGARRGVQRRRQETG